MYKPTANYSVEVKKKGRRKIGDLLTFTSGIKAFIFSFSQKDLHIGMEKSMSKAMRIEKACLWIEIGDLISLKREKINVAGFRIKESGDTYLINLKDFSDPNKARSVSRGRNVVKAIPLKFFRSKNGELKL